MTISIWRKLLIVPPIALGAAFLTYQVSNKKPPIQAAPEERVRHVRVIEANPIKVVPRVVGYGSVEPVRIWQAVPQVSGRVVKVHPDFKKGAILSAGTEIILIAPTDYTIAIRQAEANIRSAKAKLDELNVNESNTQASLNIEKQLLKITEQELARMLRLQKQGTVAQATVDQEQRDTLTQRTKVLNLENTLKLIPAQRAAQDEQIEVYQAQLETAKVNLERTSIKTPFDGRVAKADVEVTQYVGIGTDLGSIDGIEAAQIDAQIPVSHFRNLAEVMISGASKPTGVGRSTVQDFSKRYGLHAIIRLRLDERWIEWQGKVVRISDTIDPKTRTIGAIVVVDKPYAKAIPGRRPPLVKGMFVEVELRTKPLADQIVVPRSALRNGKVHVVDKDSRLEIRAVETRLPQGDFVLVGKGLAPGDKVVVSDLSPAIPGMALHATNDDELAHRLTQQANGDRVGQ